MAFDDSGGLDERHRYLAESIASEKNLSEVNLVSKMNSAFLDKNGDKPLWDQRDVEKLLEILDELIEENPFSLDDINKESPDSEEPED